MKPGISGGKSSSSMIDGPGLPPLGVSGFELGSVGSGAPDSHSLIGADSEGNVADLILVNVFVVIDWLASGEAVTIVPAVAVGAGCGLLDRNRG